jgi:DNA-binding MarR family transcriptional regulator
MTNRIDRLETRTLVERLKDPDDRRGVLVRLTPEGRTRVDAALADLLEHERDILGSLSAHERAELGSLLRRLTLPFDNA